MCQVEEVFGGCATSVATAALRGQPCLSRHPHKAVSQSWGWGTAGVDAPVWVIRCTAWGLHPATIYKLLLLVTNP